MIYFVYLEYSSISRFLSDQRSATGLHVNFNIPLYQGLKSH